MPVGERAFISFDFDHDADLRQLLVNQSRWSDSPFDIADWSLKEPLTGDWQEKVRRRIRAVDLVIVICGAHTDTASGVSAELRIARAEGIPYFLLWGRSSGPVKRPVAAIASDKIYEWTWPTLKKLIHGSR